MTGEEAMGLAPLTRSEFARTLREMNDRLEPLVKAATNIYATAMPLYAMRADGTGPLEKISDGLTPGAQAALEQVEALMRQIAEPYQQQLARGYRDDPPDSPSFTNWGPPTSRNW